MKFNCKGGEEAYKMGNEEKERAALEVPVQEQ